MDKKKNENFFLKLIKIKKEIRDCVQNGRDLKDVEKTMVSDSPNPYEIDEEESLDYTFITKDGIRYYGAI